MPRSYNMGERTAQLAATRLRIVDAAIALYTEQGISATTMREIGQRADVAPNTLRSHFAARDALERAMVDRLTADAPLPEPSIFDGARTVADRLERLLQAGGRFMDQARPMYRMWLREPMVTGPWAEKGAEYGARWDELMRRALGPLADDDEAIALLRGILQPTVFEAVRGPTRTTEQAASLISAAIAPWFRQRELSLPPSDRAG